ncbi:MAG: NADH:ubiquinone reductase (Na(+)-transporting) subunit C [Candidatus Omnitrophica bacterium]|nr:NADH:ubiquinone reductase (Na(+)-transporting) subunit C [Candidatus Omnitrophota bacterium]
MIDKNSRAYVFIFAFLVCAVSSFTLSLVSEALRPRQEFNADIDVKKNILKAARLQEPLPAGADGAAVARVFADKMEGVVLDLQGNVVTGRRPESLKATEALLPLYIYKDGGAPVAYVFPVEGKGLWSTVYGYLAIGADAITVRGISFYRHGETPGLGAEVEQEWFRKGFEGKKIFDVDLRRLRPVEIVKGRVVDSVPVADRDYYVDGISGATMTGRGVNAFLKERLGAYEPFLARIRRM